MFDSTVPRKKVLNSIDELIHANVPKQEIFYQIKAKYPHYDDASIAKGIASYIEDDVKQKYRIHAFILSALVVIYMIFFILYYSLGGPQQFRIFHLSFGIIMLIVCVFFIIGFIRFKLFYYTTAFSFYSFMILIMIYNLLTNPISFLLVLGSLETVLTFIFLYYLRKQIYPNIDFWGNVVKINGVYKF